LLHQGNVAGLVEAIANTENFDLSCQLIAEGSHPKSRCTLLDRFDNHIVVSAQVFIELQQYKDKDHISKILQQLQGIAWYHYVCIGNLTKVEELFEAEHPDRIKRLDKALELAAEHNQTEVFDWTLGKYKNFKPDYNILSQIWSGDSAGIAIKKGHQKIIECVLSSVDEKTLNACDFRALLSLAASYDRLEIIELILDKLENVSINISKEVLIERYKYSFLCYLAEKGHSEILNKLLNRQKWLSECLSEVTNQDNKNLLIIAIENRQINMVGALLESNSAERSKFLSGYPSPLIVAAKRNDIEIMHILLKYTDSFYEKDQYGKTALMVAAELGYGEIVTLLLNHPVINKNIFYSQRYLNQKTLPGELDALALAAKNGHLDVTKILLSHPLKYPDIPPVFDFKSALLQAVRFEHIEVFKLIANCEACSIRTVIDVACDSSNIELIKFIFPRFKTLGDLQNEIQIFDSEKQNEVTKSYLQSLSSQSIKTEDNQQNLHNTSTNRFGFWSPSKSTDNAPEAEKTQLEIKSENSFQNVLNNKLN
jgi:ankyrin repeat protein